MIKPFNIQLIRFRLKKKINILVQLLNENYYTIEKSQGQICVQRIPALTLSIKSLRV